MSPVLPREERNATRAEAAALITDEEFASSLHIGGMEQDLARLVEKVPALLDALDAAEAENERLRQREASARMVIGEANRLATSYGESADRMQAERDAARAEVAALRGRIEALHARWLNVLDGTVESSNFDRPTLAHCQESLRHILRALAADEDERTGR